MSFKGNNKYDQNIAGRICMTVITCKPVISVTFMVLKNYRPKCIANCFLLLPADVQCSYENIIS
jgi:hypothetical protein